VTALEVLIIQLASIFRDGKQLRMSTRAGEFISLREVLEEVGADAARYFMLMRQVSQQLEFDIDLAKKQASENPVYYIQYGHARCHSVMNKAKAEASLVPATGTLDRLMDEAEIDLIKKMAQFPECLDFCSSELDPYGLTRYMLEFALVYHKFYDRCKIIDPQDAALSAQRLALVDAARIIFANGLRLLGISAPEKM
jgi:arginyl-tRNA synthetase